MVIVKMNDKGLKHPKEIKAFSSNLGNASLRVVKKSRNEFIAGTLKRTCYGQLSKKDKGTVFEYLQALTKLSRQQLSRLIRDYQKHRWIEKKHYERHCFVHHYTRGDIVLLARTDEYHDTLSGAATKKLFERGYRIYKEAVYERLSGISVSHIYNLRRSRTYQIRRRHIDKTKRTLIGIGERRKPRPNELPGYIRIDTVHQGDLDKQKGVYHINAIDEVTQYEVICSVERISEQYLIPVLETMLTTFPFEIKGFHSDNGSEYVNYQVLGLLNKLHVEFTKSRSRHSNDNGLVECKNGAVIRKMLGYMHIPQRWADKINHLNRDYWVPYLNFHRPCFFAQEKIDTKGKVKKIYPYKNIMTPYEKLKSLPNAVRHLRKGIRFTDLDKIAMSMSDLASAKKVHEQRKLLFQTIFEIKRKCGQN
jgi:transposase InsO family protein